MTSESDSNIPTTDHDSSAENIGPGPFKPASDFRSPPRTIWVVTTAALPWRTGTAVNPLLRALNLMQHGHKVTLVVPWIQDDEARKKLYGGTTFSNSQEQTAWIRRFCLERAGIASDKMGIAFWKGVYNQGFGSIFPLEDICALIPPEEADVAILEEPEHLNWYRVPSENEVFDLGWIQKFKHVVGILHTNYGSYVKQYGMGTSLFTAPALNALSSLVVKAYCHRVIRLSETLTPLVPQIETTCNVHGVREEFFRSEKQKLAIVPSDDVPDKCAAVYFIGKLIWAKGFESILDLEEVYRAQTGEYFAIDVYGGGNDEKSIRRAFFGRNKAYKQDPEDSGSSDEDKLAKDIFDRDESLRTMLRDRERPEAERKDNAPVDEEIMEKASCAAPLNVLKDLTKRTLGTGVETAGAALTLVESAINRGLSSFGKKLENEGRKVSAFSLGPSIAAYKWRRRPLPARFLGSKDHVELKDLPHNIFLNMSTSEVLCTTSAEALAMGKFVILPKHPSNTFFFQFSNCLTYENLGECVKRLQFALYNSPKVLSEEERFKLSWKGATERLFESSLMPERGEDEARESQQAAKFHVDTSKKSRYVTNLLGVLP